MPIFKRNPFGHILFVKRWLIRIFGIVSHGRYRRFNTLEIEGSEIIRELPDKNVLFISNHQTYFADVAAMFHVFNAALKGRENSIKNIGYIWKPKLNIYYIAASETMKAGLLPKIFAYVGSISISVFNKHGDVFRRIRIPSCFISEAINSMELDYENPSIYTITTSWVCDYWEDLFI